MLLLAFLVMFKSARIVLVDFQRGAAIVAVHLVIAIVEELRLLRRVGLCSRRIVHKLALYTVCRLLAPGSAHCVRLCLIRSQENVL